MNIDENTTPDRFEALPVLLDHLNDEFMMVLTHVYEQFRTNRKNDKYKNKNQFKSIRPTQKNTRNLSRGVPASQNPYLT